MLPCLPVIGKRIGTNSIQGLGYGVYTYLLPPYGAVEQVKQVKQFGEYWDNRILDKIVNSSFRLFYPGSETIFHPTFRLT